jgi:hypothetical protein
VKQKKKKKKKKEEKEGEMQFFLSSYIDVYVYELSKSLYKAMITFIFFPFIE